MISSTASTLGWVGGCLGILLNWPQAWRLWINKHDEGLSLDSTVLGLLTSLSWLAYGCATHHTVLILTNAAATLAAATVLAGQVAISRPATRRWLPTTILATLAIVVISAALPSTVIGIAAVLITVSSALPQVIELRSDRAAGRYDFRGVSRTRWMMSALCNVCWFGYSVLTKDLSVFLSASSMTILSLMVFTLTSPVTAVMASVSSQEG